MVEKEGRRLEGGMWEGERVGIIHLIVFVRYITAALMNE